MNASEIVSVDTTITSRPSETFIVGDYVKFDETYLQNMASDLSQWFHKIFKVKRIEDGHYEQRIWIDKPILQYPHEFGFFNASRFIKIYPLTVRGGMDWNTELLQDIANYLSLNYHNDVKTYFVDGDIHNNGLGFYGLSLYRGLSDLLLMAYDKKLIRRYNVVASYDGHEDMHFINIIFWNITSDNIEAKKNRSEIQIYYQK